MRADDIQEETFSYYSERACEYDLLYLGKEPAIGQYAQDYAKDVAQIKEMASQFGSGRAIDIACGTGFWVPFYGPNCRKITLLDQSTPMLSECKKRIVGLELRCHAQFIEGDFFHLDLKPSFFDCALVGFLLSHFQLKQEERFFAKLNKTLKSSAQLMLIDGAWNEKRQIHREKSGIQERLLEGGRKFRVYKRYFEKSEIDAMFEKYGYTCKARYTGSMFFAAIADRA